MMLESEDPAVLEVMRKVIECQQENDFSEPYYYDLKNPLQRYRLSGLDEYRLAVSE